MALIDTIREIISSEIKKLRLQELGIVVSIFPHSEESDKDNYEANVKLKNSGLELRKVPISTDHIGTVKIPDIGDLVLVSYINGNLDQPVITGRFYNEEHRPPLNFEKEYIIEAPYGETTSIKIDKDKNIILSTGKTSLTLKPDANIEINSSDMLDVNVEGDMRLVVKGNIEMQTDGDAVVNVSGDVNIECSNAAVKASGNIDLGESGGAVITDMTHKCFITGAPPVGSGTVKAKG